MSTICIFAIDPGHHTGLVWGRFWEEGTVAERLASRQWYGTKTIVGSDMEQARLIWLEWQRFMLDCKKAGLPYELVIEDFILTRLMSSEREGISPVRITSAFQGYRHGLADGYESAGFGPATVLPPIYQQPSGAMTYATNERLKRWGLWIPGAAAEHEREAIKHLCKRIADRTRKSTRP